MQTECLMTGVTASIYYQDNFECTYKESPNVGLYMSHTFKLINSVNVNDKYLSILSGNCWICCLFGFRLRRQLGYILLSLGSRNIKTRLPCTVMHILCTAQLQWAAFTAYNKKNDP